MNSTYGVIQTTKNVMLTEFEKAAKITNELVKNKGTSPITWKRLFKNFPFFRAYEHFVEIQVMSKNDEDHKKWQGFSENKVRGFMKGLEILDNKIGDFLEFRPYPRSTRLHNEEYPCTDAYYIGVRIRGGVIPRKEVIGLSDTRRIFYERFEGSLEYNSIVQELVNEKAVDIRVDYKTRENLPDEVRPKPQPTRKQQNAQKKQQQQQISTVSASRPQRPDVAKWDMLESKRRRVQ